MSEARLIPLVTRKGIVRGYAIVDPVDFDELSRWTWRLGGPGYAMRSAGRGAVYMHRQLLGLESGDPREGDHVNRVKIDCRRENLRIVEGSQNNHNQPSRPGSTSQYRGVCWNGQRGKWAAYCTLNGRFKFLGHFGSEEDAAEIAAAYRAEHMTHAVEDIA
jgi:hypothetical protein